MVEVVRINQRGIDTEQQANDRKVVGQYRRMAFTCDAIVKNLEQQLSDDPTFFLRTGGMAQLEYQKAEAETRHSMANELEKTL